LLPVIPPPGPALFVAGPNDGGRGADTFVGLADRNVGFVGWNGGATLRATAWVEAGKAGRSAVGTIAIGVRRPRSGMIRTNATGPAVAGTGGFGPSRRHADEHRVRQQGLFCKMRIASTTDGVHFQYEGVAVTTNDFGPRLNQKIALAVADANGRTKPQESQP
jgi:hypothetical protein